MMAPTRSRTTTVCTDTVALRQQAGATETSSWTSRWIPRWPIPSGHAPLEDPVLGVALLVGAAASTSTLSVMGSGAEQCVNGSVDPARSWLAGWLVVAAALTIFMPLSAQSAWEWLIVRVVILAGLTVVVARGGGSAAARALVFLDVVFLVFTAGNLAGWPVAVTTVLVCILPLVALLACGRLVRLRPAAPWLHIGGPPDRLSWVLAAVTVVLAGLALTLWTMAVDPVAPTYLHTLQAAPAPLAVAGIVAFALVNSIWEEATFRGVLLEELTSLWGAPAAVVTQAVIFGIAHAAGFPSGSVGIAMAAGYGLALGIIRFRSGGILIPYLVHVGADTVIGVLALTLLR